jgi:hypothetical protein
VPTKKIFQLEQEYIIAITGKRKEKFGKEKTVKGLNQDVRSVLNGFVASTLFKLIIG